jgi:hypothetical protein
MTKTPPQNLAELTEAQAAIINKFADIQAEMSCLLRETRRTHSALIKKARRKNDRKQRLLTI